MRDNTVNYYKQTPLGQSYNTPHLHPSTSVDMEVHCLVQDLTMCMEPVHHSFLLQEQWFAVDTFWDWLIWSGYNFLLDILRIQSWLERKSVLVEGLYSGTLQYCTKLPQPLVEAVLDIIDTLTENNAVTALYCIYTFKLLQMNMMHWMYKCLVTKALPYSHVHSQVSFTTKYSLHPLVSLTLSPSSCLLEKKFLTTSIPKIITLQDLASQSCTNFN